MSSLTAQASLIVAAFDLLAVRAVTDAGRAADLESGDVVTPTGIVEKPEPAPQADPQPDAQPTVDTYQSGSRLQTRLVPEHQPVYTANLAFRHPQRHAHLLPISAPACDHDSAPTSVTTNPIEPPWKVLPWMDRAPQRFVFVREIKLVAAGSDITFRGKMIDIVA